MIRCFLLCVASISLHARARIDDPCVRPLYEQRVYDVNPGTLVDIFVSHQTMWNSYNRFECGYDATFARGGSIKPSISNGLQFTRHSFFGVYFRTVPLHNRLTGILVGLSAGFDSSPKVVGNRYLCHAVGLLGACILSVIALQSHCYGERFMISFYVRYEIKFIFDV